MAYLEEGLGYSSKDILGNVRRTAKALLQQALLSASQDREDKGVDILISERDKLRHEEMKLSTELSKLLLVETLEDVEVGDKNKVLTEAKVKKLEDELLSMKLHHFQENKLLECFQHQEFLIKQLFPVYLETEDENQPPSSIEQQVVTLQTKLDNLLTITKDLETLRKDLEAKQVERTQAQVCCRELMSKVTELAYDDDELDHGSQLNGEGAGEDRHKSDCAGIIKARSRCLKRNQDEVMLYRHTLMCLIEQSGVDWSEDEELCKLVVALGQLSRWTEGQRI